MKKILIVDDSKVMRNIQRNILSEHGFTDILEAGDGQEALKLMDENKFDLVLLDWNIPNVDGLQFVKIIKMNPAFKDIPIIMVTSEAEKRYVEEAMKAGVNDYIIKPLKANIFFEKVKKFLL